MTPKATCGQKPKSSSHAVRIEVSLTINHGPEMMVVLFMRRAKVQQAKAKKAVRSYGAMSFAGLKSLIFTNAKRDDPRVQSVLEWIGKNYDFTMHPGMDTTSYFYYLQTASEALKAYGSSTIKDARGRQSAIGPKT